MASRYIIWSLGLERAGGLESKMKATACDGRFRAVTMDRTDGSEWEKQVIINECLIGAAMKMTYGPPQASSYFLSLLTCGHIDAVRVTGLQGIQVNLTYLTFEIRCQGTVASSGSCWRGKYPHQSL